MYVVSRPTPL